METRKSYYTVEHTYHGPYMRECRTVCAFECRNDVMLHCIIAFIVLMSYSAPCTDHSLLTIDVTALNARIQIGEGEWNKNDCRYYTIMLVYLGV